MEGGTEGSLLGALVGLADGLEVPEGAVVPVTFALCVPVGSTVGSLLRLNVPALGVCISFPCTPGVCVSLPGTLEFATSDDEPLSTAVVGKL